MVQIVGNTVRVRTPASMQLSADGVVAIYGYVQGYVAALDETTLEPVEINTTALSFEVEPEHRKPVVATLRKLLSRPGTLEPTTGARESVELSA